MQWYVYDHYNIALTGKSYMKLDDQVSSMKQNIYYPKDN